MALTLSARVDADFSSLVAESKEAQQAIAQLSDEADRLNADARDMAAGLSEADRSARDAASGLSSIGDSAGAIDRTAQAVNWLHVAQQEYFKLSAAIHQEEAAGIISKEEAAFALSVLRDRWQEVVEAERAHIPVAGEASDTLVEFVNAALGIQDAVKNGAEAIDEQTRSIADWLPMAGEMGAALSRIGLGASPMALLRGGMRGVFAAVTGSAATAGIASVAAAVAAGGLAWNRYLQSVKAVEVALEGVGRRAGVTRGEMELLARDGAAAGDVSVRTAREMEVSYLRMGGIGTEVMSGLIARTKDFAATMGVDFQTAQQMLGEAFADPTRGAEAFAASLHTLTDAEVEAIRRMDQSGEVLAAQRALFPALDRALVKHRDSVTALGNAWDWVARKASNAWDMTGRLIDATMGGDTLVTEERLARLVAAQQQTPGVNREQEIARLRAELAAAREQGALADISARSTEAGQLARRYSPDTRRLDELRGDSQQAGMLLMDPAIRDNVASLSDLERAYDATSRAIETWLDPASRATEQHRLDIAAISAKTPAQLAEIAAERERLALAGEAISTGEAEARIANAREQAYREAAYAIEDQNAQIGLNARLTLDVADAWLTSAAAGERAAAMQQAMNDNFASGADVATRFRLVLSDHAAQVALTGAQSAAQYEAEALALGRLNDAVASRSMNVAQANREAQIEAQLRPLITAAANAEGTTKEALTRIIDELTAAMRNYNAEAGRSVGLSMQEAQRDEIAMLELQRQHVWSSTQVRDEATAVRLKELEALRAGVEAGSAEMASILEQERAIVRLTAALSNENATREIVMSTTESALNKVADQLASGELSWSSWGDVAVSVLQDVTRQLTRMAITAPIMNGLFGTNMPTLADAGGLIGSIFHAGGVIGTSGKPSRFVPHNLVASAPRFHSGGLINDNERVIIAEVGEEMLTANDPRHIRNIRRPAGTGSGWGGGDAPRVELHIHEAPGTKVERRETQMPDGGIRIDAMVRLVQSAVADDVANGRSPINSSIEGRYGLRAARK